MLQKFVAGEGDGWQWTLRQIAEHREGIAANYVKAASLLGHRTADLHLALATERKNPNFQFEPLTTTHLAVEAQGIRNQIDLPLDALQQAIPSLLGTMPPDDTKVLGCRSLLLAQASAILAEPPSGFILRVHGDYHLGQVLRANDDFVILDFEGEPSRPLAERRKKCSPLKDVAGMLRSFSYAAWAGLQEQPTIVQAWQDGASTHFIDAYQGTMAAHPNLLPQPRLCHYLLRAYLLEKACYELLYELNNRPAWVQIPISGITSLLEATGADRLGMTNISARTITEN